MPFSEDECFCDDENGIEDGNIQVALEGKSLVIYDAITASVEAKFDVKFCPMCGREL